MKYYGKTEKPYVYADSVILEPWGKLLCFPKRVGRQLIRTDTLIDVETVIFEIINMLIQIYRNGSQNLLHIL